MAYMVDIVPSWDLGGKRNLSGTFPHHCFYEGELLSNSLSGGLIICPPSPIPSPVRPAWPQLWYPSGGFKH